MKSLLAFPCPIFVLALGLISCNKQKSSTFRIPEPSWETGHGLEKFSANDHSSQPIAVRSINERLSFENSPAARLRISTHCRNEGDQTSFRQVAMFELPNKVALFSMLPAEALRPSVLAQALYCSFSFQAINSDGSTHSFQTADLLIRNSSLAEGVESTTSTSQYNEEDFPRSEFRLHTSQAADAKLICDQLDAEAQHPDHRYFSLSEFHLPKDDKFRLYPTQNCRIAIIKNDVVSMISAIFAVNLKPLIPSFESLPLSGSPNMRAVDAYAFHISNPSRQTLHLRIAPINASAFTGAFKFSLNLTRPYCGQSDLAKAPVERIHFKLEHDTGPAKIFEDAKGTSIILSGQSDLEGRLEVQFARVFAPPAQLQGAFVRTIKPIEVQSFSDDSWKNSYTFLWKIDDVAKIPNLNFNYPVIPCAN